MDRRSRAKDNSGAKQDNNICSQKCPSDSPAQKEQDKGNNIIQVRDLPYKINIDKALSKKAKACNRDHMIVSTTDE